MMDELGTPSYLVVALAVNGSKKTKYVVKWALDKFVPEGMLLFKLFFIRPKINRVPTPSEFSKKVGLVPVSQVREDLVIAYRKEVESETYEKLVPFKNMCARRKVEVEIVQIESDDVVDALKQEVVKNKINKLVIGASSSGIFSRGQILSSRISENIPSFCTVYVISKGILSSLRAADSETIGSSKDDSNSSDSSFVTNSSNVAPSSRTEILIMDELGTPSYLVVALAVNGSKKTKYVVKWALDKFVPEGMLLFKLFFIRPKINRVPTPSEFSKKVGLVPVSQVREDLVIAYRKEVESETYEKLVPFKNMCARRKVAVEIVQIESDDVVDALKQEVAKHKINKLVIGASSSGIFSRGQNLSSRISENIPSFCTVYVISKGILSSLRAADSETIGSSKDDSNSSDSSFVTNSSNVAPSSRTEWTDQGSATSYSQSFSNSLPMQRFEALSSINRTLLKKTPIESSENNFIESCEGDDVTVSDASNPDEFLENSIVSSSRSFLTESQSWTSDQDSIPDAPSEIASDIHDLRNSPPQDNKAKEQEAKSLAEEEKKQRKAAKRLAEYAKECIRREAALRKDAEEMTLRDSRDKQKFQHAINGTSLRFQEFTWEEIVDACCSFSEDLKIGTGGNGTVYKSSFHHTVAAVKVLHSQEAHRTKQFQQEC
ncbi:hypothetical protein M8C21_008621 [Ambrosia artemisiifolia]|uniref:RING-type E3 ubiquitin transferase n=1 Tax=Ambrosia artemisiifolia TaxID=4212 RepID=A0AAD5GDY1_AMBAR|nr:hypothetical protein M8C21_008621 [Ambrosia artemisiifolia]